MTTTTIDYTNISATDDGAAMVAALKLELQHAQADMVLKPNVADTETISGVWTHSTTIILDDGTTNTPNLTFKDSINDSLATIEVSGETFKVFGKYQGGSTVSGLEINLNTLQTAIKTLNISTIPTSATGLVAGDVWSNSGVLTIV